MRRIPVAAITALGALATIAWIEQKPSTPIGNLAECCAVIGILIVLAWATSGAVRNTLMVISSLLVGLTLVDGGLRAFATQTMEAAPVATSDDSGLHKSRPIVGWGPWRPGVFRVVKKYPDGQIVYDARVTIDATLNRKTVPSADMRAIAFFGDSFIFGEGLDDDETLPQAFSRLNGGKLPVWNFAFSGWSPAQNLSALQSGLYASRLKLPRHFVLFTGSFHVERTACKGDWAVGPSARYVLVGDTVVNSGPCATSLKMTLTRFARRFALFDRVAGTLSGLTRKDVATYLKIVEAFVATARREYDVPTTVLFKTLPDDLLRGTGYTEATMVASLRKAGIDVLVEALPQSTDPSLYEIKGDGHPTALANEAVARQLEDHLKRIDPAALAVGNQATALP